MVLLLAASARASPDYGLAQQLEGVKALELTPTFFDADAEGPRREGCEAASTVKRSLTGRFDAGVSLGTLDGARAGVLLDGPGGSGRYWTITVGVTTDAGVVGACLHSSTLGHRWSHQADLGKWEPLQRDAMVVWGSLPLGTGDVDLPAVLVPRVFTRTGTRLALDRAATAKELERFATAYEKTNDATLLTAARVFRTWVALQSLETLRVPDELRARTSPLELSGLTWVPSLGRYLVVSDDTGLDKTPTRGAPWVFRVDADGGVESAPLVIEGVEKLDDAESITAENASTFWLVTSHSLTTKGKSKPERRQLLQLSLTGGALKKSAGFDLLDLGLERLAGGPVDVEAVAFREGKVLVGLKAPLDAKGRAQVFQFDPKSKALTPWKSLSLTVQSVPEGVSDLLVLADGSVLIAANAPKGGQLDHGGALWLLAAGSDSPRLLHHFPSLKPEGLSLTPDGKQVRVVFDRQDAEPKWLSLPLP